MHGELAPGEAMRRLVGLTGEMVAGAPPDPLVAEAARQLGRPGARVGLVARQLGISERQLHRRCVAAVGYGPVLLRRVLRFRRVVSRIDAGGALDDLAGLAALAGYADQAHLTRESQRPGRPGPGGPGPAQAKPGCGLRMSARSSGHAATLCSAARRPGPPGRGAGQCWGR